MGRDVGFGEKKSRSGMREDVAEKQDQGGNEPEEELKVNEEEGDERGGLEIEEQMVVEDLHLL